MNGFMFMMRKRKEGILDREPYATFLKKFNKLGDNIVNQNVVMDYKMGDGCIGDKY